MEERYPELCRGGKHALQAGPGRLTKPLSTQASSPLVGGVLSSTPKLGSAAQRGPSLHRKAAALLGGSPGTFSTATRPACSRASWVSALQESKFGFLSR